MNLDLLHFLFGHTAESRLRATMLRLIPRRRPGWEGFRCVQSYYFDNAQPCLECEGLQKPPFSAWHEYPRW